MVGGTEDSDMVEVETGADVVWAVEDGVGVGVVDVVARMDDETAELIDESMDEDSAAELDVAGALVVV